MTYAFPAHEDEFTEFKAAWSDSVKKTFCAFLNGRGGTVYFGIDDHGNVVGVKDPDDVSTRVSNVFRGMHPESSSFFETSFIKDSGKTVVAVKVHVGPSTPYKVDVRGEGSMVYVRRGPSTFPATDEEVRSLYRLGDPTPWELYPSRRQDLTFNTAAEVFAKAHVEFSERTRLILRFHCREDGGLYTNLAFLLSDQCDFQMRLGFFDGRTKAAPMRGMYDASGSLLGQFETLLAQIKNQVQFTYSIGSRGERVERYEFPKKAVREALINTCVHRDYTIRAAATIAVFSDRMEFLTIGSLPRKCNPLQLRSGITVCRNEHLCDVFFRLGHMEKWGIGIPTIYESYEGESVSPEIECTDDMVRITLPRLALTELGDLANRVLAFITKRGIASRPEVQEELGLSYVAAIRLLNSLKAEGYIVRVGSGPSTRYKVSNVLAGKVLGKEK